jgi:hypothetical protein
MPWNPSGKAADITLSGGDLTATHTGGARANAIVRGTNGTTAASGTGYYFEVLISNLIDPADANAVGLCNTTQSLTGQPGLSTTNSVGGYIAGAGNIYLASSIVGAFSGTAEADYIGVAIKSGKVWYSRIRGGTRSIWNNNGANDPVTDVGGVDISTLTGTIFPCGLMQEPGDIFVLNTSGSGYAATAPSGFGSLDGAGGSASAVKAAHYARMRNR